MLFSQSGCFRICHFRINLILIVLNYDVFISSFCFYLINSCVLGIKQILFFSYLFYFFRIFLQKAITNRSQSSITILFRRTAWPQPTVGRIGRKSTHSFWLLAWHLGRLRCISCFRSYASCTRPQILPGRRAARRARCIR